MRSDPSRASASARPEFTSPPRRSRSTRVSSAPSPRAERGTGGEVRPLRILIAPQAFKGSLTATQAAQSMAKGIHNVLPDAAVDLAPIADGGDGTVDALVLAAHGETRTSSAHDALMRPITAPWGVLGDGTTAVVEMAATAGLARLASQERDPLAATTYGVGEQVRSVLDAGFRRIIIGLGGSATNEGGSGLAHALGARFLDANGHDLPPGGLPLLKLERIDVSSMDPRLRDCAVHAACDVTNPLCGPTGASTVFAPQKGASPDQVALLDRALGRFAEVVRRDLGRDVASMPGAGAAGGLGAGLVAFLSAELMSGFDLIAQATSLAGRIEQCDLVLTGEGRLDGSTMFGKAPVGIAKLAGTAGKPVIAVVGSLGDGYEAAYSQGLSAIMTIAPGPLSLDDAVADAANLLVDATARALRLILLGQRLPRGTIGSSQKSE